jgi:hypothetical protein
MAGPDDPGTFGGTTQSTTGALSAPTARGPMDDGASYGCPPGKDAHGPNPSNRDRCGCYQRLTVSGAWTFLRAALVRGLRPTWALVASGLAIVGGTALGFVASDPLWLLVAALAVLLLGAFRAWDEAERRAAAAEPKAAQADLLRKRNAELSKMYTVSQAQYKVFEDFNRRA